MLTPLKQKIIEDSFKAFMSDTLDKLLIDTNEELQYLKSLEDEFYTLLDAVQRHFEEIIIQNDRLNNDKEVE